MYFEYCFDDMDIMNFFAFILASNASEPLNVREG